MEEKTRKMMTTKMKTVAAMIIAKKAAAMKIVAMMMLIVTQIMSKRLNPPIVILKSIITTAMMTMLTANVVMMMMMTARINPRNDKNAYWSSMILIRLNRQQLFVVQFHQITSWLMRMLSLKCFIVKPCQLVIIINDPEILISDVWQKSSNTNQFYIVTII
uniref:ORF11 n=1 Tax=Kallithea virus TaxID=1654582 RepID=A0A0F7KIX1_9VIRU|nr:ORF11 [Kallithea virus]